MSFQHADGVRLDAVRAEEDYEAQRQVRRRARNRSAIAWIGSGFLAVVIIVLVMVFIWSRI
ncbi:hypothetical protein N24_2811 [Corynebacterium suranareeae]|uniref:Uncharacterized protein n=1 Tax=Corynebacterium suranareeae TaxID=2506452 RepID=A0A160PUL5_9CORY|nr:hypothetical protein [Corynebacterium suranareeae]BAU97073.1 hypothetical protein N24_2811 [Corynebacterium suranareeae]